MRYIDLKGKRFGRLFVLEKIKWNGRRLFWKCKCDCGKVFNINGDSLRTGRSKSCGCLRTEKFISRTLKHGHTRNYKKTKEYRSWANAKQRCFNTKNNRYKFYGGRGITMCLKWKNSFSAFIKDMGLCPKGKTLDRTYVNKDYKSSNCQWVDYKTQGAIGHRNNSVIINFEGRNWIMKDLSEYLKVPYQQFATWYRRRGKTIDEIILKAKKLYGLKYGSA